MCWLGCANGWYGPGCNSSCDCLHQASCHHVTGQCACNAGWVGPKCNMCKCTMQNLPLGFFHWVLLLWSFCYHALWLLFERKFGFFNVVFHRDNRDIWDQRRGRQRERPRTTISLVKRGKIIVLHVCAYQFIFRILCPQRTAWTKWNNRERITIVQSYILKWRFRRRRCRGS